jgi:Glutamine amidotransferase domain
MSHDGTSNQHHPTTTQPLSNGHHPSTNDANGGSRHGTMNGLPRRVVGIDEDGNPVASAAVFKDVFPAWNNMNLRELCMATSSNCIMAHVRAASKGTGISHQNCHPFKAGRLMFCHNGRVFEFFRFRRRFKELLSDEAYNSIMGTTDSEVIFALLLTYLAKDGHNEGVSPFDQTKPFGMLACFGPRPHVAAALSETGRLASLRVSQRPRAFPRFSHILCVFLVQARSGWSQR